MIGRERKDEKFEMRYLGLYCGGSYLSVIILMLSQISCYKLG